MKTIQEEFDELVKNVFDGPVPADQYEEMRRIFFAGSLTMFNNWLDVSMVGKEESIHMVNAMNAELEDFAAQVKLGTR